MIPERAEPVLRRRAGGGRSGRRSRPSWPRCGVAGPAGAGHAGRIAGLIRLWRSRRRSPMNSSPPPEHVRPGASRWCADARAASLGWPGQAIPALAPLRRTSPSASRPRARSRGGHAPVSGRSSAVATAKERRHLFRLAAHGPGAPGPAPRRWLGQRWHTFAAPTDALPVDLFRVGVGLTSCVYFLRTLREASGVQRARWTDRPPVGAGSSCVHAGRGLSPGDGAGLVSGGLRVGGGRVAVGGGGIWVKPVGAGLYLTAVSAYRWNFPVTYLDDTTAAR